MRFLNEHQYYSKEDQDIAYDKDQNPTSPAVRAIVELIQTLLFVLVLQQPAAVSDAETDSYEKIPAILLGIYHQLKKHTFTIGRVSCSSHNTTLLH